MSARTGKGRRWLARLGWAAGAGVLALAAFWLTHGGAAPTAETAPRPERVVAVTTEPVTARPVRRTVPVVGSLYGRDEVVITAKVEGRAVRVRHDVGDVVKPGEVLLEIDPTDYRLAAAEAQRALDLELAKVGLKELPGEGFDVTELPPVERAAVLERNAAQRRDRIVRLGAGRVASAEEREQSETEHEVARANHRQAVLDAAATLAAARHKRATLDMVLQKVKDTRVTAPCPYDALPQDYGLFTLPAAPVEYVVSQRSVTEGEYVRATPGAAATLFKLVIDRPLKLQATVPERHRAEVRVGQVAEFEVEAYPGQKFRGKVARVNPAVDRASRTFQFEVLVANEDRRLGAGSFVKGEVLTHTDPAARTVPEEALVSFAGVTKVFVVRDGRAHEVQVRTGVGLDEAGAGGPRGWVEVEGDLRRGDAVVTSGQSQLAEGTPVRVRGAGQGAGEGTAQ
jgi:multidrug efflux pump subunit AcrA (membrane-fusion protein)